MTPNASLRTKAGANNAMLGHKNKNFTPKREICSLTYIMSLQHCTENQKR